MDLVLATRNLDKIKEIKDALKKLEVRIFTLKDFPDFPCVEEDEDTLYGNALKKARTIAKFSRRLSLADDSGLEVEALGGAPGVFSARFAGQEASYEDNNLKLLSLLEGIPPERRKATFRCIMAISEGNKERAVAGVCKGIILTEMVGSNGFGYDSLFKPEGSDRSFAQMSLKEKEKISHRGKALRKAKKILEDWESRLVLGLTGSIGSGKSTVARMFQELGAEIIDADKVGHSLLEKKEVRESIVKSFGSSVLDKEGKIERRKLGSIVFRDRKRLEELNSIIHPLIFSEIKRRITFSQARVIIIDAAILLETGWDGLVDRVIVVNASHETRRKRIKESSLLSSKEVEGIIKAQFSQDEKIQRADFLIENEISIKEGKRQVERIWGKLVASCSLLEGKKNPSSIR